MTVSTPERSRSRPSTGGGPDSSPDSGTLRPRTRKARTRKAWARKARTARRRIDRGVRGTRAAVVVVVAAALLVTAGVAGFRFLSHEVFGPKAQVDAYLAALVSGDQAAATGMLPPSEAVTPLDPEIYAAADNRITGYEVLGVEIEDGDAVVSAELEQGGTKSTVDFALYANGSRFLAFTAWQLQHTAARSVAVTVPAGTGGLRINGRDVPLPSDGAGTVEVRLLPGGYRIQGPDTRYLSYGSQQSVLVEPGMAGDPEPMRLFASVTAELTAEVQVQAEAYLQACLERAETAPAACPNAAYAGGDATRYRNAEWTLEKAPTFSITGTPETGLAVYATGGKARVSYQEDVTGGGSWEDRSDLVNIPFRSDLALAGEDLRLSFRP